MANGDTTVSRLGQVERAGDARALFLKKFGNEVLKAYGERNVMQNLVTMRSIKNGKSAQFPALGRADAYFHTPGKNIMDAGNGLLSQIPTNERVINIDNKLISAVTINDWEDMVNHYDVRKTYTVELGRALAKAFDKLALNTAVLAARSTGTITIAGQGHDSGTVITDANMASAKEFVAAAFLAAQRLDEKEVPNEERYIIVPPSLYYTLIKDPNVTTVAGTAAGSSMASNGFPLLNADLNSANGSYARAELKMVAGFTLIKSNHIPKTNILSSDAFFGTGAAGANGNVYHGDFSKTVALGFCRPAIGVLQLQSLALESEYKLELQGDLTIAKMAVGMGTLRPDCAIEFATP